MGNLLKRVGRFLEAEDGATAVEYAVMLGAIIVVCILAVAVIGTNTSNMLGNLNLKAALGSS